MLYITQQKTGSKIAIPLNLSLNVFSMSIVDVINKIPKEGKSILNISAISLRNNFSKYLPEIENKPTFHEIRSLSARLYEEEKGAEFANKLLGHKSMAMTSKYLDNRNNEYLEL
ncbi:tyrosine-type recombinase/integrase [Orbus wheelerorum]|uniref:tyrosine-type recombinase/integrase n=1 Tax=Orbus wheelerorum TaxID=3074111 RepID=UPI00370D313D